MTNDNASLQGLTVLVGEPGCARSDFLHDVLTGAGIHVIGPVQDAASLQEMLEVFAIDAVLVNALLLKDRTAPALSPLAAEAGMLVFGSEATLAATRLPRGARRLAGPLTPETLCRGLQLLLAAREASGPAPMLRLA
ncbi:hypothetical protein BKE38_03975 [Pseudoroseomonas deserti]|uniref:Response regulatory domain-containing protein n=1 Tax=Teichococcus deserti TaxID=1817963 RepID=A0A1V2H7E2_9PROT|nr:hypothetical protein [Pseudoroseomonas deserti]ONG57879.1 hypothetical protein BKE38_03975 [Pseudoroseomonas deserti]